MIDSLVRDNVKKLEPYTSARHLHQTGLLLDANENAFGSVASSPVKLELNRYPDPYSRRLKKKLSAFLKVSQERLFVGVGSDEIIDLLIRLFLSSNEEVLILEPTYGMYRVAAEIAGVECKTSLLSPGFQVDRSSVRKAVTSRTKIIFCCSPNNPTGNLLAWQDIEWICSSFRAMVVVDEAYIEFARSSSLAKVAEAFENLVVLRTFSKAWGLAGARIGYGVMDPIVVDYLNKIKPPYNLSSVSAFLAEQALRGKKRCLQWTREIVKERQKLSKELKLFGFEVFPSEANFILVRRLKSSLLARQLAARFNIVVRDVSGKPGLSNCLRITIGTPSQNKRLLKALGELT